MEGRVPGGRKKSFSGDEFSADEGDCCPTDPTPTPLLAPLAGGEDTDLSVAPTSAVSSSDQQQKRKRKIRAPSFRRIGNLMQKVVQQVSQGPLPSSQSQKYRSEWTGNAGVHSIATSNSSPGSAGHTPPLVFDKVKAPGVVGIRNHGNTCFLNAVLQCLNNSDLLVRYFVLDHYKLDIKRNNKQNAKKYGTKGELTEHLAALLKSLWTRRYQQDISSEFKSVVGKYGSQYRGYAQHDAQEFLMWLLDKVHEDLNIASKKKYRANKSSHGRSDEVVAQEAMANHTRCNNSAIHGFFQGLCRSSLTCPKCGRQSITFDPILSLSLPIPQKTKRPIYVTVVYYSAHPRQVRIGLLLNETDTVKDLRHTLATDTKIQESQLILTEIYADGFHRTFHNSQQLSDLHESDQIYAIEAPPPLLISSQMQPHNEHLTVLLLNKQADTGKRFGSVIVLQVSRDLAFSDLQNDLVRGMAPMLRNDSLIAQNVGVLFRLHVVDGLSDSEPLPHDVELPLYMPTVDRALSLCLPGGGPQHLKLMVEWDRDTRQSLISDAADDVEEHESVQQVKLAHQQPMLGTLDECLQLYMQEEKLGHDNAWLCPSCHRRQQDTVKALRLWSLPEILVIHLKRFKQDTVKRTKLNTLITFPVRGLDMTHHLYSSHQQSNRSTSWSPWRSQKKQEAKDSFPCQYDLFAVCNHYGNMQGGHYTAFSKNPISQVWHCFDDTKVTSVQEGDVITRAAYILFYQRKGSSPPDSSIWMQRIAQVSYTAPRAPPVSKSHEDLLDSNDADEQPASNTLPINLNPAHAVPRSVTSASLNPSPVTTPVRPLTGVMRQRSKEAVLDGEAESAPQSTLSTPVHRVVQRHSLTRSMTSPEVTHTITRKQSSKETPPLQQWDYKRCHVFLQESSV